MDTRRRPNTYLPRCARLDRWLREDCIMGPGLWVPEGLLLRSWNRYCFDAGLWMDTRDRFVRRLKGIPVVREPQRYSALWRGLRLRGPPSEVNPSALSDFH